MDRCSRARPYPLVELGRCNRTVDIYTALADRICAFQCGAPFSSDPLPPPRIAVGRYRRRRSTLIGMIDRKRGRTEWREDPSRRCRKCRISDNRQQIGNRRTIGVGIRCTKTAFRVAVVVCLLENNENDKVAIRKQ